jgi:tetratricopeptide (TPR) repeat protein
MKQKLVYLIIIFLIIVSLAAFGRIIGNDFTNFDDNVYVTENSHIQSGITPDGFRWAFGAKYFNLWLPLTLLSFMFDYQLYGLNAGGYHLTSLVLHILSSLLLFWLFCRMTGAVWKSAFVAAFFALHPLHVESVAWIAERKDVLSAFFWMITLCLYVYYTEKPVVKRYLLVLFAFVLALLSKPMVVSLPVVMILLDYWPLKRFELKKEIWILWQLKEKMPFFILSLVLVIITLYSPGKSIIKHFSAPSQLTKASVNFVTYLGKTFWPQNLAIYYPFPTIISAWQIFGAVSLIILVSVTVVVIAKRMPYLFVGWMWYIITLMPVIGIIQIGSHTMADRYHYLPSIGIGIMLAWGIPYLIKSEYIRKKVLLPAGIIIIILLAVLTWQQCAYWKNSITLFSRTLQVTKDNYIAHNHLASALFKKRNFDGAIYHYNEAIRINPVYADAYYNRGITYYILGRKERALEDFIQTIRMIPKNSKSASVYNNIGITYFDLGQYQLALDNYNEAINIKPDYSYAYNNRAFVYLNTGNIESGCGDAKKACELGNCTALQAATGKGFCR